MNLISQAYFPYFFCEMQEINDNRKFKCDVETLQKSLIMIAH